MNQLFYETLSAFGQRLDFDSSWSAGKVIGTTLWHGLPARREETIQAIISRLGLAPEQAVVVARESFVNSCRSFLELFLARRVDHRFLRERVIIQNPELLRTAQQQERPIVATTAHFGSWEIQSGLMSAFLPGRQTQVVVRKQRNQAMYDMITRLRSRPGMEIVPHRLAARRVLRCLAKNGATGFLVDHNCSRDEAVFLPFLGKIAAVNMGPALLALRAKAVIWPTFIRRIDRGRYEFILSKPLDTAELSGSRQKKIENIARFYTNAVADQVRICPEQWFWMHRRWKTRPPKD